MARKPAKRVRAPHKIGVGFLGAGTQFTGELVNVSMSGLLVRCENSLPVGTMGRLGIEMEYGMIRTVVVIRRIVERVGLAFEFSHMGPRDRQTLQRLLLRLEQPTPPGPSPSGSPSRTTRR
jgi:c-di-GMP-binding flagellar brake protein YcgR